MVSVVRAEGNSGEQMAQIAAATGVDRHTALSTAASLSPVTIERPVRTDLDTSIPKPYLARALVAPDMDHPNGTPGHMHNNLSVMQQHCSFFDQDDNGIIYPWESYSGLRQIGFNMVFALIISIVIHIGLSYPTLPGWIPNPLFPIYLYNIHKAKHGSDTGVYDNEGRFMPANFEGLFSKHAQTFSGKLTLSELWTMTQANKEAFDLFGWVASKVEWGILYILAQDQDGCLSKEAVRRCYDGSLFEYCAKMQMGAEGKMKYK